MKSALKRISLIVAGLLLWSLLFNGYWHLRYALEEVPEAGCVRVICRA